jgi:hypothetical protein
MDAKEKCRQVKIAHKNLIHSQNSKISIVYLKWWWKVDTNNLQLLQHAMNLGGV